MRSFLVSLFSSVAGSALVAGPSKPDIVYSLADDLGYGDVQCRNPQRGEIATAHLEKLAGHGVSFADAHSGSSVCTPTSAGICC